MRMVSVKLPETYIRAIDELVEAGVYTSRNEAIRIAVRELLKRELWPAYMEKRIIDNIRQLKAQEV